MIKGICHLKSCLEASDVQLHHSFSHILSFCGIEVCYFKDIIIVKWNRKSNLSTRAIQCFSVCHFTLDTDLNDSNTVPARAVGKKRFFHFILQPVVTR